jgi:hypothetical protein
MKRAIYLDDAQRLELIEFYEVKEADLKAVIKEAKEKLEPIRDTLAELRGEVGSKPAQKTTPSIAADVYDSLAAEYPINSPWHAKITYIINSFGRFVTQSEIMKRLNSIEGHKDKGPFRSVSSVLSQRRDIFSGYKPKDGTHFMFGLSEWLDEKGNIKPEFLKK